MRYKNRSSSAQENTMIFIWLMGLLAVAKTAEIGEYVGCYTKKPHGQSQSFIGNCFDFCKYYR